MSLVTFAVGSLGSKDRDVHLAGTKILHKLVVAGNDYSEPALARVRDSPDAIESLFRMIASASPDGRLKRARTTIIMAKLSVNLSVSAFPCAAMRAICSLLDTREDEANPTGDIDMNLILEGMDILEQLSRNPCNLLEISNSHELMSRLIGFTSHDHVSAAARVNVSEDKDVNFRKVMCSLEVFRKLAMDTGKQGITLRQEMLQNVFLLSNIREILQHPSISHRLRIRAIRTVSGFALDAAARDHGGTTKMLRVLLSILCNPHGAANNEAIQLAAGKAIAELTTESRVNCGVILREGYLQTAFRDMLRSQHGEALRVAVANVVKNLCEYSEPGSPDQNTVRDFAGDNISMVLTRIDQTENLVGEDMEAFLGLALQFSKLIHVGQFNVALAEVGCENFACKLKLILEANNRPNDKCPGIRRFTIEQAIWMMQSESELHCIQYFVRCSMQEALGSVQETARQENYKLLSGNIPVLEYEESPSSLVKRALELIQQAL